MHVFSFLIDLYLLEMTLYMKGFGFPAVYLHFLLETASIAASKGPVLE